MPRSSRRTSAASNGSSPAAATPPQWLGRELLRLPRRHRDRPPTRGARPDRPPGEARDREREARLPAVPEGLLGRALAGARGGRSDARSAVCGRRPRPRTPLPRRPVRRGADRAGHGQHDAARDRRGVPGSRSRAGHAHRGRGRGARVLAALAEAGVDYDDVVETLEREGVEKFSDSLRQVLDGIEAKRAALRPV